MADWWLVTAVILLQVCCHDRLMTGYCSDSVTGLLSWHIDDWLLQWFCYRFVAMTDWWLITAVILLQVCCHDRLMTGYCSDSVTGLLPWQIDDWLLQWFCYRFVAIRLMTDYCSDSVTGLLTWQIDDWLLHWFCYRSVAMADWWLVTAVILLQVCCHGRLMTGLLQWFC